MSGIITGREFIDTFPACDAAVQGDSRAALLQATYVALYEIGCLAGAVVALFYGNSEFENPGRTTRNFSGGH